MKKMDLFKIGMYISMGSVVGKYLGELITAVLEGAGQGLIMNYEKHHKASDEPRSYDAEEYMKWKYGNTEEESEPKPENTQATWSNLHDLNSVEVE